MTRIESFSGAYRFLSNFFIEPDNTHVEGEYQRAKCDDARDRELFVGLNPFMARAQGHHIFLRPDWEEVKLSIMYFYVSKKFKDHPILLSMLQQTGTALLIEGNTWGDTYWGKCKGKGQNMLGYLLMEIRAERFSSEFSRE